MRLTILVLPLALFLTTPFYAGMPFVASYPVSAILALVVALQVVVTFIFRRFAVPAAIVWPVALFGLFLWGGLLADFTYDYALSKTLRLFTITLFTALAPLLVLRSEAHVRRFFAVLALVCSAIAIVSAALSILNGAWRVVSDGVNVITTGRAAGIATLTALVYWLRGGRWLALPATLASAFAVVGNGSRGPLLFGVFTAGIMILLFTRSRGTFVRSAILVIAVVAGGVAASEYIPAGSVERLTRFLSGETDANVSSRAEAYLLSVQAIKDQPLGFGWGGFGTQVGMWAYTGRPYPHNLILEMALETGVPATLAFLVIVAVGLNRARRFGRVSIAGQFVFAMLMFTFLNAMVSGDINDNRMLFGFLSLALMYTSPRPRAASQTPGLQYHPSDSLSAP